MAPGCLPGRRRRVSESAEKSRLCRDRLAPGAAFRCRADLRVHGRQRGVMTQIRQSSLSSPPSFSIVPGGQRLVVGNETEPLGGIGRYRILRGHDIDQGRRALQCTPDGIHEIGRILDPAHYGRRERVPCRHSRNGEESCRRHARRSSCPGRNARCSRRHCLRQ